MKTPDESKAYVDLIFENRNQSYGAYVIRKSYSKNVAEAALASIFLLALVVSYPRLCKLLGVQETVLGSRKEKVTDDIIIYQYPPPLEPKAKPVAAAKKQMTKDLPPHVTTAVVPEVDPVPSPPTVASPGIDGQGIELPVPNGNLNGVEMAPLPPKPPVVVDWAEVMPEFPGGVKGMMAFVRKNLKYPRMAKQVGTEGKVFIQFVVNSEGKVVDVKVITGISQDCDKEAARVIAMFPDWKPGRQGSEPVSVRMVLPINYKLEN